MKIDRENAIMAEAFLNLCGFIKEFVEDDSYSAEEKVMFISRGVERYQKRVKEDIAFYNKEW